MRGLPIGLVSFGLTIASFVRFCTIHKHTRLVTYWRQLRFICGCVHSRRTSALLSHHAPDAALTVHAGSVQRRTHGRKSLQRRLAPQIFRARASYTNQQCSPGEVSGAGRAPPRNTSRPAPVLEAQVPSPRAPRTSGGNQSPRVSRGTAVLHLLTVDQLDNYFKKPDDGERARRNNRANGGHIEDVLALELEAVRRKNYSSV